MPSHQFRGRSGRRTKKRGGFSQASTRRGISLYDQHGRLWTCQVGNKSGMPTGQITPNFRAPWYPDQQFLRVNRENTSEMFIDYDAMILRRNARITEFHRIAVDFARDKKLDVPTKKGEYSDQLLRMLGGAPKPIQPVIAARQGNVYILGADYAEMQGVIYAVDPRLERYIVKPPNEAILDEFDFSPESTFAEAKSKNAMKNAGRPAPMDAADATDAWRARATLTDDAEGTTDDTTDEDLEAFDGLGADADDNVEAMIEGLEEEFDAAATGGHIVAPKNVDRAARQAPRRPGTKTATKGHKRPKTAMEKRREAQRGDRATLATGAAPVIGGGGL